MKDRKIVEETVEKKKIHMNEGKALPGETKEIKICLVSMWSNGSRVLTLNH